MRTLPWSLGTAPLWLVRAQSGGRHIGPGNGSDPVEMVDVKDVARFLTLAIDRALYGVFNLTGRSMTFREFLDRCKTATRSDAKFVWIPEDFLHRHQLETDGRRSGRDGEPGRSRKLRWIA